MVRRFIVFIICINILVAQQNQPCNHPIIEKGLKDINSLTDKELVLFQLKYEECNQYKNKLEEYERVKNTPDSIDFLFDNCFIIMLTAMLLYNLLIPSPDYTPDFD